MNFCENLKNLSCVVAQAHCNTIHWKYGEGSCTTEASGQAGGMFIHKIIVFKKLGLKYPCRIEIKAGIGHNNQNPTNPKHNHNNQNKMYLQEFKENNLKKMLLRYAL